ncbi:ABC transporter substrate-binding protein [Flavobacterium sp.]|uniref:ABC transporter substrate-binding protein n=1 Tax=Flavobacterium sp. TaxID=239 RepID=UPI00375003A6
MLKICSFLPAATSMIYEMGLENELVGVTFECPSNKPKVVRTYLEGTHHSSKEIDQIVSQSKAQGKSLYYIDDALLASLQPDIIFTQDVCDVCQIDTSHVARSIYKLTKEPELIPLIPRNLEDIYKNAITIAKAFGKEERAYELLVKLKIRTDYILNTLRKNNAPLKRVMVMEWLDPIYNCGHWIPYQISQAGGVDMLSNPSGYSIVTDWERIRLYNPEVLVVAPCGFEVERASQEIEALTKLEGWDTLKAVQNNAVFMADADLFTQPSTTVVDGIELLAALFHPTIFEVPSKLKHKYLAFHTAEKVMR